MDNLLFLGLCLLLGLGLRHVLPPQSHRVLNGLLIYVCLPALTLLHTVELRLENRYWLPVLMPWVVFGGSWVFFRLMARRLGLSRQSWAALMLTAGIPSVSFVGFPIFDWLYGAEGLKIGVLMSQAGSFLVCNTVGVGLASYYAATQPSPRQLLTNVLTFPPFGAFLIALTLNLLGWHWPPLLHEGLLRLGNPFGLLALLSVGLQVDFDRDSWRNQALWWGLGYKLLLAPVLVAVWLLALSARGPSAMLCLLGSGLGPMNTIAVIAAQYDLDPPLVARMVGIGIPLSLLTVGLIYALIYLVR